MIQKQQTIRTISTRALFEGPDEPKNYAGPNYIGGNVLIELLEQPYKTCL